MLITIGCRNYEVSILFTPGKEIENLFFSSRILHHIIPKKIVLNLKSFGMMFSNERNLMPSEVIGIEGDFFRD